MERKANVNHVKKCFDEICLQIESDRAKQEERMKKMEEEQKEKIN